jgi:hypothetical protein
LDLREYYQHLYDEEWTRRHEARQYVAVSISALTFLAGVLVFFAKDYPLSTTILSLSGAFFFGLASVAWFAALVMLARGLMGRPYSHIPFPSQLEAHRKALLSSNASKPGGEELGRQEFTDFLIERLVDAADHNEVTNRAFAEFVYRANRWLVATTFCLAIASVPAVVQIRLAHSPLPEPSTRSIRSEKMQDDSTSGGDQSGSGAAQPAPQPDSKPAAPQNYEVRTGVSSPEVKKSR